MYRNQSLSIPQWYSSQEGIPLEELQVFADMAAGDHKAYMTIYNRYRQSVYVHCLRICKNADTAKELTQHSFVHIWKKKELFRDKQHPAGYLYKVVYSQIYQYLKKTKNKKEIITNSLLISDYLEHHAVWDTPQEEEHAEWYLLLDEAIASLPPKRHRIFMLHRFEGLSHSHIAQLLDISEQTVATTIKQAIRYIKIYVQERSMSI